MPTTPLAVVALLMTGGTLGEIVAVTRAGPVPMALVALTKSVKLPATVGVPVIWPVAVLTAKPIVERRAPDGVPSETTALKLAGVFVAAI